jgi:hypothetical protein
MRRRTFPIKGWIGGRTQTIPAIVTRQAVSAVTMGNIYPKQASPFAWNVTFAIPFPK